MVTKTKKEPKEVKLAWTTERRKPDDLVPYEANPRTISATQKEVLIKSLNKFDLVELPVINKDNTVVAGHQRLAILKLLGRGQEEIEIRIPNRQLTPEEFKEYLLTSNRNSGDWDWNILKNFNKDTLWSAGFDSKEIDKIFHEKEVKDDKFDAETEYGQIQVPDSKPGEVYILGDHRLMCGDATKPEDLAKLMNGEKANMVFTDPPYNINYQGPMNTHDQAKRAGIENDNMSTEEFADFMGKAIKNLLANTAGAFYICMSSKELWAIKNIFEREGGHWQSFIIWVKNAFTLGRADWQNKYEPILYGWNGDLINHFYAGWRNESNVWEGLETLDTSYDGKTTTIKIGDHRFELEGLVKGRVMNKTGETDIWNERKPSKSPEHPTMKPIKLVAKAIRASSTREQIVLDTFGGSGSTLIASEELGRKCYMMELDPKYCDVIRKRFERLTKEV